MSKTYSIQVEKSRSLITGIRKNYDLVNNLSITHDELNQLERDSEEAERMNSELETLRAEVSAKASVANKKLSEVKTRLQEIKSVIKKNFDQSKWEQFGIFDKR